MSAASIDRCLRGARVNNQVRGVSTTKPSPLLRSSIQIRKAGDEVKAEPGFFEGDTVARVTTGGMISTTWTLDPASCRRRLTVKE